ncbi:MAG: DUF4032 domain-containing protein [Chloroherpetonaceae bacterium]
MSNNPATTPRLDYDVDARYLPALTLFPFEKNLEEWQAFGVAPIMMRRGDSRHQVIFVKSKLPALPFRFAIKEISLDLARREIENYHKLRELGVQTLTPVGIVTRRESTVPIQTPAGVMYQAGVTAYLITLLEDAVLPESVLFGLRFQQQARKEIFDAIAELFAQCHALNVYWGDASLDNLLIKFVREEHTLGKRRRLVALLADTETTEIHPSLSQRMKEADLEFFFESMLWLDEEFHKRGNPRDKSITLNDIAYLRGRYNALTDIWNAHKRFDSLTQFNSERHFGRFRKVAYADTLLKHLEEHKWYLSERMKSPVSMRNATLDWYANYFLPIQDLLKQSHFADYFPDKTELEVYLEIMENKYYLSEQQKRDVGLSYAIQDFAKRFGIEKNYVSSLKKMFKTLIDITKEYAKFPR